MGKQNQVQSKDDSQTQEQVLDLDSINSIWHWKEEIDCWKEKFSETKYQNGKQVPFRREVPIQQRRWENFIAASTNPVDGKAWTDGEGSGHCLGKEGPKRVIYSITRFRRTDNSEWLLSTGSIIGFNQYGDKISSAIDFSERWTRTKFSFRTSYDLKNGQPIPKRICSGPSGSEIVYSLPFSKENFQKLWEMRRDNHIQLIVHDESQKKISVKNQLTSDQTLKLFTESEFDYLYNANYLSIEEREKIRNAAMNEGLIPRETADETKASVLAQQSLSQKDKMASYG